MKTKQIVLTALTVALVAGGAAFAGPNGNGKSNGRGASNNDNGRNSNGVIASELKWRNAAHASDQAFLNASPNSAVGILATLKNTVAATGAAYAEAGVRDPRDIQIDIDAIAADILAMEEAEGFDLTAPTQEYTDLLFDLAFLDSELTEAKLVSISEGLSQTLQAEEDAVLAVGLDSLSEEAIDALWALLDN